MYQRATWIAVAALHEHPDSIRKRFILARALRNTPTSPPTSSPPPAIRHPAAMAINEQQLIQVLERTISANQSDLQQAHSYIEDLKKQNIAAFLLTATKILGNSAAPEVARLQAGLQAKNCISSKDESTRQAVAQQWQSQIPDNVKEEIKSTVVATLGTENKRPSSAAQLVAAIGGLELPEGKWKDLMSQLSKRVIDRNGNDRCQEACLEAIGYICADLQHEHIVDYTSDILTAIVHAMKSGSTMQVKLAATNAMLNALEFINDNFEKSNERDYIMQVICEASQNRDTKVKISSLQCLVKIVSLYYDHMETYMARALFAITTESMRNEDDGVCLQGIEFWSNVCDEEYDLAYQAQESWERGQPPTRNSQHYAKGALAYLMPILCQTLSRQDEADCEDDWNPSKASGVCVMLLAQVTEDEILDHILPFVEQNISKNASPEDWKWRDAAVVALGSILEGPTPGRLEQTLAPAMNILINMFNDPSVAVRDSTAWCIGKVCETVPRLAFESTIFPQLLNRLITGLEAPPRVATNVCWAISHLVSACYDQAEVDEDNGNVPTYQLSGRFQEMVQKLMQTTDRPDSGESNLRAAAYEAIMEMIKSSPDDCYNCVKSTTHEIMNRIDHLLTMRNENLSAADRTQYADLQSLLCATLQSVLRKIKDEDISSLADQMMQALLLMLQSSQSAAKIAPANDDDDANFGGVHEDALLAIGTLTEVTKGGFINYMEAFKPFLVKALQSYDEPAVCQAAVGVIGDISRALGDNFGRYCEEMMTMLLTALNDPRLDQSVRPHILSLFGDIAMAIGKNVTRYLNYIMQSLKQAAQVEVDKTDFDQVDYLNELHESVITSITGIIHGLKGSGPIAAETTFEIVNYLEFICQLIKKIAADEERTDSLVSQTCGLLGDIITTLVTEVAPQYEQTAAKITVGLYQFLNDEGIKKMLNEARVHSSTRNKQVAVWASRELRKLKNKAEQASQGQNMFAAGVTANQVGQTV